MHRRITAWLWRFRLFRWCVTSYVHHGLPGHRWLAEETPFLSALREWALRNGHYDIARDCTEALRSAEARGVRAHG